MADTRASSQPAEESQEEKPPALPQPPPEASSSVLPSSSSVQTQESIVAIVECPVCFDVSIPIYQCRNGHIICGKCYKALQVKACPSCRVLLDEPTRNLALEKILKNYDVQLACKFSLNGCAERMPYSMKDAHQAICPFRTYSCPLSANSTCAWEGPLDEIIHHLKGRSRLCHSVPVLYGETATFFFPTELSEVELDSQMQVQIQTCFGSSFLIAFRATVVEDSGGDSEYCALVQQVGRNEMAMQFAYRMELQRDSRRLSWEAVPLEIADSINENMDRGDCLFFNSKTMRLFKTTDVDMIPIDVTISLVN